MMTEDTEKDIRKISVAAIRIDSDLNDIKVSLQILSGRTSLKKYRLEEEIKTLEATVRCMKRGASLFGAENETKIQELEASLEQKKAALDAEEERIFNEEINK